MVLGPWPPDRVATTEPMKPETEAEKIARLEREVRYLSTPKAPEPYVVMSSPLGRLFNLKPSKW